MSKKPTYEELEKRNHGFEKRFRIDSRNENLKHYRQILDCSPSVMYTKDLEGRYTFINKQFENLSGLKRDDVIGKADFELFPPLVAENSTKNDKQVLQTGVPLDIEEYGPVDGKMHTFASTKYPLFDEVGMIYGTCGISSDVTKQKKAENELSERIKELNCLYSISHLVESRKTLSETLQEIADIISGSWQYPLITSCRIVLNENVIRSKNDCEESCDKCSHIFLSQPIVVNGDIAGELRVCYLEEAPEADEGPFLSEERDLINAIAERIGRIAEKEKAEKALRKSEERFSLAMAASRDGIWDWDLTTGEIYCSPGLTSMLGYDSANVLNNVDKWQKLIHPGDRQKVYQTNIDCLNNLFDSYEVEYRMKKKDGGWKWILGRGKAVHRDISGSALRMVGTIQDITYRKQAEEKLRQEHDLLEERVKERTKELTLSTKSLEEVNSALNVLLRKRDEDKRHFEENILFNVKELIEPQIKNLKNSGLNASQMAYICALETFLKDIVSPFSQTLHIAYRELTISEIKVANLVREGKTTKEIAALLGSTDRAIDFHRQNLRKKLGLYNRKINLASFLTAFQE